MESVYQFQEEYNNKFIIIEIGLMENVNDVYINEFKYGGKTYVIKSCLYTKGLLAEYESKCIIPIFKILSNDGEEYSYNFHIFDHKKKGVALLDMVSDYKTKILLYGFFTYKHNNTILSQSKEFDKINAIKKLIKIISNITK